MKNTLCFIAAKILKKTVIVSIRWTLSCPMLELSKTRNEHNCELLTRPVRKVICCLCRVESSFELSKQVWVILQASWVCTFQRLSRLPLASMVAARACYRPRLPNGLVKKIHSHIIDKYLGPVRNVGCHSAFLSFALNIKPFKKFIFYGRITENLTLDRRSDTVWR